MTPEQKLRNQELIREFGLYPQSSVFEESCYILRSLSNRARGYTLFTDEHKSYVRAARAVNLQINHETISSRERRDQWNPLFPINRLHNLYRHFFSSQQREAIAFQKNEAALMDKIQLMKIYRNFMAPKFVKKNKHDPLAHEKSPAMYVGVAENILSFQEIFGERKLFTQVVLDAREADFLRRSYPFSRQIIAG